MNLQRDWGAEGVHWTGVPGDEIQRLDNMSDYGRDEPILPGDMEAALHVARNGFPWIFYEQNPDDGSSEANRWFVTAFPSREAAVAALTRVVPNTTLFVFDALELGDVPHSRADGNGFLAPEGAILAD